MARAKDAPQTHRVEVVPLADLAADPANARRHTDRNRAAIKASRRRTGAGRSIVLDGKNVVRAGNGTVAEAQAEGIDSVLVVEPGPNQLVAVRRPDWGPTEAAAYAIADNRAAELAEWDDAALAATLSALDREGVPAAEIGFDAAELEKVLAAAGEESTVKLDYDGSTGEGFAEGDQFGDNFEAVLTLDSRTANDEQFKADLAAFCGTRKITYRIKTAGR